MTDMVDRPRSRHPEEPRTASGASRRTQALRLAVALIAGLACGIFAAVHAQVKAADFYVFWAAARHWQAPYDPAVVTQLQAATHVAGAWPFVYPPTFLLFLWPFGQLPLALAFPLWTGLSAALFFWAAAHLIRPAWATLALLIAPPVVLAVSPGQTSLVVGAAMIGGWLLRERRPALAGVLFAISACIKPQAMVLAPIVLWGQWRTLRWAAGTGAALVLASLAFGPGLWLAWPKALAAFAAVVPATDRINPSALIASPLWAAALALLGVALAWRARNLAGLIGGGLCLTPYTHAYDLAPLAPVVAAWLVDFRRQGFGLAVAGAALLAGLVATPLAALAFCAALMAFAAPWRARPEAALQPAPAP